MKICKASSFLEEKIHLIKCEMTEQSEEFNGEFNSSRLNIQIQQKRGRGKNIDLNVKICKVS